jgi:PKD repeat protein
MTMKPTRILKALVVLFALIASGCEDPAPIAAFSASLYNAMVDEMITFTNTSENATSYSWDFGDGNSSTQVNPTHSYANSGMYNVQLTATGEGGTNTSGSTITVTSPPPVAQFSMNKSKALAGENVTFTNTSQYATSFAWDFGDGKVSNVKNPVHRYAADGVYFITLTAVGDGGTDDVTQSIQIEEAPANMIPGDRLGSFVLGNNLQSLFVYIYEEEAGYGYIDLENGEYLHLLEFDTTGIGFVLITTSLDLYFTDVPVGIYAFVPFVGRTELGITLGSLLSEVEAAYGTPDEITTTGSYSYLSTLGISFWADDSKNFVEEIYISEPEARKSAPAGGIQMESMETSCFRLKSTLKR